MTRTCPISNGPGWLAYPSEVSQPRVCIIGAGSSGITAAQVLAAQGVDFDCFESGSTIGGNWRYDNDNEMSSAYESLHINTSRQMMEYRAYPMPESLPDYPDHRQIAAYFDDYVDHFGLRARIRFRTEVVRVQPLGPGRYSVTVRERGGETEVHDYDAVIVANGHHWNPRWPEPAFPGADTFPGEQLHAHYYRTPDVLDRRRVLVLGIGNSACDIAVESSRVATDTVLAMRRGAYIVPKFMFGVPTDHLTDSPLARGPVLLQKLGMRALLRLSTGKVTDYGLPKPDHQVLEAHPTVSQDLLNRLGHGDITVRPNIARIDGSTVRFVDGTSGDFDVIVYCTGYQVTFPFLDDTVVPAEDNHVDLYRRVVDPEHPAPLGQHPEVHAVRLLPGVGGVAGPVEVEDHPVLPGPLRHRRHGGESDGEVLHDDDGADLLGELGPLVHVLHGGGGHVHVVTLDPRPGGRPRCRRGSGPASA